VSRGGEWGRCGLKRVGGPAARKAMANRYPFEKGGKGKMRREQWGLPGTFEKNRQLMDDVQGESNGDRGNVSLCFEKGRREYGKRGRELAQRALRRYQKTPTSGTFLDQCEDHQGSDG